MSDEYIPTLTLDPNGSSSAAAEMPVAEPVQQVQEEIPVEKLELSKFSEQEQAAIRQFATTIDVTNSEQIMNYGVAAQKNISEFSAAALNSVRTKDLGEMGDALTDLVVQLKSMDFEEEEKSKGFFGFFRKAKNNINNLKAQYDKVEVNVNQIASSLSNHERTLLKDVAMLDKMYEKNQAYYKELTMYILAGKLRAEQLRNEELPKLQAKAQETNLPEDAQAASDFANMIGRFEKRLYDLELTRVISLQMAPQIRMIQNNNTIMAEKIQTSLVNTIPLWKSQMVMALTMHHSKQTMEAQREVSDVTNQLLKKNAEALHQGSVEIARESERGIVELDTLKKTNQELISSLEEVRQIQEDGRAKRAAAEEELGRIEGELKQKLLELRG